MLTGRLLWRRVPSGREVVVVLEEREGGRHALQRRGALHGGQQPAGQSAREPHGRGQVKGAAEMRLCQKGVNRAGSLTV